MKARQIITITLFALLTNFNAQAQVDPDTKQKEVFVDLKTFPSPSDGNFLIELELKNEAQLQIQLLDMNGRIVHEILPKQDVDRGDVQLPVHLDTINKGVYLLLVDADGFRKTQRVVFTNY